MTKRRSNIDIALNDQKNLSIQESNQRGRPYLWGLMTACVVALGLAGVAQADDALVGKLMTAGLVKDGAMRASKLINDKDHTVCKVLANALMSGEIIGSEAVHFTNQACSSYEVDLEQNDMELLNTRQRLQRALEEEQRNQKMLMDLSGTQ